MKNKDKVIQHTPLYYIVQPKLKPVVTTSQDTYIIKRKEKQVELEEQVHSVEETEVLLPSKESVQTDQVVEDNDFTQLEVVSEKRITDDKEPISTKGVRKSFKLMTIEEKIHYLLNKPFYIPEQSVNIKVKENKYTGYVKSINNGIIVVKQLDYLDPVTIRVDEIDDIKLHLK